MRQAAKKKSSEVKGKSHRVCCDCKQIIRRHDKWCLVKRRILRIFGVMLQYKHRDCSDPQLLKAKVAAEPAPPMHQWLLENNQPVETWVGNSPNGISGTIQ